MKTKDINIEEELKKFRFSTTDKVKFAEVDSFGVVHNIQYLYWLEAARVDYFERIGIKMTPTTIIKDFPVMVVNHNISYHSPLLFADEYSVYCRISTIKNSSIIFENIIINEHNQLCVAIASSVLVHINRKEGKSSDIPEEVREMIKNFEGENVVESE